MLKTPLHLAAAMICELSPLAVLSIAASISGLSQVPDIRQSTKAPSDGFRPSEFPPRGADLEVIAGGIGCIVRVRARPGTSGRRAVAVLNNA